MPAAAIQKAEGPIRTERLTTCDKGCLRLGCVELGRQALSALPT